MEEELYYIKIENAIYHHEDDSDDYGVIKLKNIEEVYAIINDKYFSSTDEKHIIKFITNDKILLSKYIFCLNQDDLKMLCGRQDYSELNTRIRKKKYYYPEVVYYFFENILNHKFSSAVMYWENDDNNEEYYRMTKHHFQGWVIYKEQYSSYSSYELYSLMPFNFYKNKNNTDFYCSPIEEKITLKNINDIFTVDVLELGKYDLINQKQLYKYFDRNSRMRLYISQKVYDEIKKDYELINNIQNKENFYLKIEIKLDHNFYVEYNILGAISNENSSCVRYEQLELENDLEFDNNYNSNNWLRDAAGTNDPETMNDVFWNLD